MSTEQEAFLEKFQAEYMSAQSEDYGSARMTTQEFATLKGLYGQVKKRLFGDTPFQALSNYDRDIIRSLVIGSITENGWPMPPDEAIGAKEIADTAVAHACVVAQHLIEERGIEASRATYFSYTTKNQFDRFVYMVLIRAGKMQERSELGQEWHTPQDRVEGYENANVEYPQHVDNTKIHGVAKPHRYWPAQLLRVLEEIRLGQMSSDQQQTLKVGDTEVSRYTIPWMNYRDVIEDAESVDDIAIGTAVRTMEILHGRGLTDEQITELVVAGYSPKGPISEHGSIPQVHAIWSRILDAVKDSQNGIAGLGPLLKQKVEERIGETGN